MRISRAAIEQARANLRLQQANAKTDPDAQLGYKRTAGFNTLYAAIQIPLPVRNRNQGQIEAAVADIKVAESSLASTEALVRSDLESAMKDYESRQSFWPKRFAPCATGQTRCSELPMPPIAKGGSDILRLLDAERTKIETQLAYTRSFSNFSRALLPLRPRKETCHENSFDRRRLHRPLRLRAKKPAQAPPEAAQKPKEKENASTITLDQTAQQKAHIVVATVKAKDVAQSLTAPGQLTVNEDQTWRVGAVASGKIDDLTARVGDSVRAGQVLGRIHSHDVHEARAAYQQASTELERARAAEAYSRQLRDRAQRLFELKAGSRQDVETAEAECGTHRPPSTRRRAKSPRNAPI